MISRRPLAWSLVILVALIGIAGSEYFRRLHTHDYAARRGGRFEWPDGLTLDRSELQSYLRHQFNVVPTADSGEGFSIRAGLCQLAGRDTIEPVDRLAADATLRLARQEWFHRFVEAERPRLHAFADRESVTLDQIRHRFLDNLAAQPPFTEDFTRFLNASAQQYGVELSWITAGSPDRNAAAPTSDAER